MFVDQLLGECPFLSPIRLKGSIQNVVITGHENELGHTIDHRESYWTSLIKLEDVKKPSCLMTWERSIGNKR